MQNKNKWQCRIAPSLGDGFAGHPNDVWGTVPYTDPTKPCVFFGMYGLRDYQALMNHNGKAAILWAGSDIRNFVNGYWFDKSGDWRLPADFMMFEGIDCYVENSLEKIALASKGVKSKIIPSFLGDVTKYQPQEIDPQPRYYTSVSGDDFELYGWDEISEWAQRMPEAEFHLYGNQLQPNESSPLMISPTKGSGILYGLKAYCPNVFIHGRVPQEQMDAETKTMTGALRLTRFDGFSEILAKSILWGQKPLSPYIHYDFLDDREKFLSIVNKYPWNAHTN